MNSKIWGFLVVLLIISIIPVAYAQISFGEKAIQKSVEVKINSVGDVHVKHIVKSSNVPKQIEFIDGTVSNISVTNENNEEMQFVVIGDNDGLMILPSKINSIVEYDLDDVLSQIDKVWTWDFRYLETTSFILPNEVDLLFSNERLVYLDEKKGINCHGCEMILEYSIDEPKIYQNIKWEDKEFLVEMRSHSNIDEFTFDQPTKSITFDVSEKNRFVTTIIPLELLWGPYAVFLDDEKIYFNAYINNGTHVWLNIRPETTGEVTIIGTTVVPEFPIIAPLVIGFLVIVIVPLIRKVNLH
ncbi:hypothetical protein [Nitrosopumilus ureiphilus]|uniref:Copper-binding protein n=1 Tax=Nitrosopumilus ureiphilus TaxID=1470067 RepID=A0A7D5M5P3_9ARCH|nr:hypothetical protein [Nitrosopumilus ureiphilus]QLH07766.1 hypothetical protein C5F50_12325 [Nitrosopumilus ureiphilus]